jgi:eukaryotic-like serine/threonine-protein kinase
MKSGAAERLGNIISRGGMGVLRAGIHAGEEVAVKTAVGGSRGLRCLRHEASVLAHLPAHPGVVPYRGFIDDLQQPQLVLGLLTGHTLSEWRRGRPDPTPVSFVARVGVGVAAALAHLHGHGVVHRDVTPTNIILVDPSERPRSVLLDFGLAGPPGSLPDSSLKVRGRWAGSPGFAAPEQIRRFAEAGPAADIYGLAVTLYWLLAGVSPYLGFQSSDPAQLYKVLENPPVPLRAYRPDAPRELESLLARGLIKCPRERGASVMEFAAGLMSFAS